MTMAYIILAHGSRDPQWRYNVEAMAAQLQASAPEAAVACAYLELCEPTLAQVAQALVQQGRHHMRVLPLFFGIGKHASEDIPQRLADLRALHPQLHIELLPAAGDDPGVRQAVVALALGQGLEDTAAP